jgi:hypothetical protein
MNKYFQDANRLTSAACIFFYNLITPTEMPLSIRIALLGLLIFIFSSNSQAQYYQWEEKPELEKCPEGDIYDAPLVILQEKRIDKFITNPVYLDIEVVTVLHRKLLLKDTAARDSLFEKYLLKLTDKTFQTVQIRLIKNEGLIIDISDLYKKSLLLLEKDRKLKLRSILNDLNKDDILEYYTVTQAYKSFGDNYTVVHEYPLFKSSFELIAPQKIDFYIKSYCNFKEVKQDTINEEAHFYTDVKNIPPQLVSSHTFLPLQPYNEVAYCVKSIEGNNYLKWGWKSYGEALQKLVFMPYKKDDHEIMMKLLNESGIKKIKNDEEKIVALDGLLKKKIKLNLSSSNEISSFNKMFRDGTANLANLSRFLVRCFEELDIDYELVRTSALAKRVLDPTFEDWNLFGVGMFYFPKTDKYLVPGLRKFSYPLIPNDYSMQGVFYKIKNLYKPISYRIQTITPLSKTYSVTSIRYTVDFKNAKMPNLLIDASLMGYSIWDLKSKIDTEQSEINRQYAVGLISKLSLDTNALINYEVKYDTSNNYFKNDSLIVNCKYDANSLFKNNGDTIIFNVGKLLGPPIVFNRQYQCTTSVTLKNNFVQCYEIDITLPEGYEVVDVKDWLVNHNETEIDYSFKCTPKIDNNTLKLIIEKEQGIKYIAANQYSKLVNVMGIANLFSKKNLLFVKIKN